jgi:multidrug resistance protein
MIGFLFASFGVTLLTVSLPMGAISDRIGRKLPMVGGLVALAAATLLFAFATSLPWLFAARLVQGAADAVTWVVGFALIADRYGVDERGRVTGIVMSGTSFAFMIGPSIGGWLYEVGGIRLPFLAVTALSAVAAATFVWLDIPDARTERESVPLAAVLKLPAVAACTVAVVAASATLSMLEPVLALHLGALGIGPARIGLLFGFAAVLNATLHPLFGRLADRWGARRMMLIGLTLSSFALTGVGQTWSFASTIAFQMPLAATMAMMITPSLAYMAEATSVAGMSSFGVAYGVYNMAWGAGLLSGPAIGGFVYERIGFGALAIIWGAALLMVTIGVARVARAGPLGQVGQTGQVGQAGQVEKDGGLPT